MATAPKRPRWNLSGLMGRLNAALPAKNVGRGAFSGEMHAPAPVVLSVREENYDELDASALVPRTLRVAAAFSWRTLVVVGLVTAVLWAAAWLTLVIMPVAIALTLAVLLEPLVSWMRRKLHFPSSLAAAVGLLVFDWWGVALVAIIAASIGVAITTREFPKEDATAQEHNA